MDVKEQGGGKEGHLVCEDCGIVCRSKGGLTIHEKKMH